MHSVFCSLPLTIPLVLSQVSQVTNQYEEDTGVDGSDIWRSTSDFIPLQGDDVDTEYGTITIGEIMTMEFDFVWGGYSLDPVTSGSQYENFFRVGFSDSLGSTCNGHGSRYPSMWMTPPNINGPYVHVSASYKGSCQLQEPSQTLDQGDTINIGESYHIVIS